MARISNYDRDANITLDDKLLGSSYEGEGISGPIYETKNFKISNLAAYLNLIFTVDEVNYNLHQWRSYLEETNYTLALDANGNIQNLARLNSPDLTEIRFDVSTLRLWNETTDESVVPFENRNGLVKLKKSFYDVSFEDIPDVPPTFILTTVYADNYQGSNQSLTRDTRNFYGIYQGSAKLTEEDLPVTGVDWNQITGDPGLPGDPGPDGRRVAQGVIWYGQGAETAPTDPVNPAPPNQITYDFDTDTFNAYPDGWQQESPSMVPGSASSKFYTARYNVTEDLDANGDPTGSGVPTFGSVRSAFVFNQVVAFQSEIPEYGYTEIDGGYIKTVRIQSINYDAPDTGETFADAGMLIDLLSSRITSKYMVLDDTGLQISGSGTFSGDISAASGNFGGVNISSGGIAATGFSLTSSGLTVTGATIGGWTIDSNSIHTGTKDTSQFTTGGITFYSNGTNASIHSKNFYIDVNGNAAFKGDLNGASIDTNIGFTDGYIVLEADSASLKGTIQFIDSTDTDCGSIYSSDTSGQRGVSMYSTDKMILDAGTDAQIALHNGTSTNNAGKVTIYADNGTNIDGGATQVIDLNIVGNTVGASGSIKLSNGAIMKWGYTNGTASPQTVTFPVAFPNACRSVSVTADLTGATSSGWGYANTLTAASFRAVTQTPYDFWWIAIGD